MVNDEESRGDNLRALNEDTPSSKESTNKKWTAFLIFCTLNASLGSFQFGFNIGSLNSPSHIIKGFIKNETFLFKKYHEKLALFKLNEEYIKGNETKLNNAKTEYQVRKEEYLMSLFSLDLEYKRRLEEQRQNRTREIKEKFNMTIDEYLEHLTKKLADGKQKLETYRPMLKEGEKKVDRTTQFIWTILNALFVVGGMIGAFTSKYVLDFFGRRIGIIFHNIFSIIAAILVLISVYLNSPVCILVSRFLYGIQGGMCCSVVPTYLAEISPSGLRGTIGTIHQLFVTIGILSAQILGFQEILGDENLWNFLLAVPIIPALICSILLLFVFPESPKALLIRNDDYDGAKKALQKLRKTKNVNDELAEIQAELKEGGNQSQTVSIKELFSIKELKWPLITSFTLQITQQLSGVNAIFFYSASIFKDAGIPSQFIQYAILSTGVVNVLASILCVPLIDRLGRRPLLLVPTVVIAIDFILLTTFLTIKEKNVIFSYLSIASIIIFVVCFAVSYGPIPFLYTAEVFRQNSRSTATALCVFLNWSSSFLLTITFPFLQQLIQQYVFLIFTVFVSIAFAIILKKLPETKGKNIEEILASF